jgi:hypothetical protein
LSENPRQEVEIKFGGRTYLVRPTYRVLTGIETALQQPVRTLGLKCLVYGITINQRNGAQEISLTEMAVILQHMLRGQDKAPQDLDEIGDILMDEGYGPLCSVVSDFLMRAQRGNIEHMKELKRKAEQEKNSPPGEGSSDQKAA